MSKALSTLLVLFSFSASAEQRLSEAALDFLQKADLYCESVQLRSMQVAAELANNLPDPSLLDSEDEVRKVNGRVEAMRNLTGIIRLYCEKEFRLDK